MGRSKNKSSSLNFKIFVTLKLIICFHLGYYKYCKYFARCSRADSSQNVIYLQLSFICSFVKSKQSINFKVTKILKFKDELLFLPRSPTSRGSIHEKKSNK